MLLEHVERQRDAVAAQAQRAARAVEAAQQQSRQLNDYRGQYEQRWHAQFRQQGTAEILDCYQGFTARLGQAIGQQEQVVVNARAQSARMDGLLRQHEIKLASIRKLIERRVAEVQIATNKREQKQTDEAATRGALVFVQAAAVAAAAAAAARDASAWGPLA
jgi:flagellar FliJ protein